MHRSLASFGVWLNAVGYKGWAQANLGEGCFVSRRQHDLDPCACGLSVTPDAGASDSIRRPGPHINRLGVGE